MNLSTILSHRNNWQKRQTLRQTWIETIDEINANDSFLLKDSQQFCHIRVDTKFIIADKDCPFPKQFRTTPYDCHRNDIRFNASNPRIYLQEVVNESNDRSVYSEPIYRGFSFVIRHSVVVTQLAIHHNFLRDNPNITIALLNARNKAYYGFTDFESISYKPELLIGPTFAYEPTEKNISQEMVDHKDILLIDSIDVYRNLAEKVVQSMKLRVWPLDYWGKWAENDYESPLYPTFACGSGYVLSADLVQWIASNANYLHRFQGEDVSMGIWLSAIKPNYKDDKRWICNNSDLNDNQKRLEDVRERGVITADAIDGCLQIQEALLLNGCGDLCAEAASDGRLDCHQIYEFARDVQLIAGHLTHFVQNMHLSSPTN
ncbi:unnamed protein product [Oppiella nova]|uniref:Hexosyltransferase n=1 Tax=Oppiella nova TaxID=334625 RepID=A0A7R9L801_9ACAR|nr:unnamed protein product [Oppiella nova]CAG2158634.1 unnamed protein product [Oppiella nova]